MDFLELEWTIFHSGLNPIWHHQKLFQQISIQLMFGAIAFTQLEIKETVVHAGPFGATESLSDRFCIAGTDIILSP